MKAKILTKISILLGVLAMFFAGCQSHGKVVRDRGPIAKYGVPQEVLDQQRREMEQQQDSTANPAAEPVEAEDNKRPSPDRQPKKYGPMPPRD